MSRSTRRLTQPQIIQGYRLCLQNVAELAEAALRLVGESRGPALALAQIGQEELGKSMLLLMSYTFTEKADWRELWRRWNNHDAKANAAALYEWVNPLRITLTSEHGSVFEGLGFRDRYSSEKEAGLYVDFDEHTESFKSPSYEVSGIEALGRTVTMFSLGLTASSIHDAIFERDGELRMEIMSHHTRRLWSGFVSQEDMERHLNEFESMSEQHAGLLTDLREAFRQNREQFAQLEAARSKKADLREIKEVAAEGKSDN